MKVGEDTERIYILFKIMSKTERYALLCSKGQTAMGTFSSAAESLVLLGLLWPQGPRAGRKLSLEVRILKEGMAVPGTHLGLFIGKKYYVLWGEKKIKLPLVC